jgi:acyl carrier protein
MDDLPTSARQDAPSEPGAEMLVRHLLVDLLNLTEPVQWNEVRYQEHHEWDSLVHMALVTQLETKYSLEFSDEDIMSMEDLGAIVAILQAHGV